MRELGLHDRKVIADLAESIPKGPDGGSERRDTLSQRNTLLCARDSSHLGARLR